MLLTDKKIICESRSNTFRFYVLGDLHLGARNCAENQFRRLVNQIAQDKNAYWLGGGDLCDCINPPDLVRFGFDILPNWILEGSAEETREKLRDIISQQRHRLRDILKPIKAKCLGLIEGNHEHKIRRRDNLDHHGFVCNSLNTIDLTSEALIRLQFERKTNGTPKSEVVKIFICHGHGGGRTAGAEPCHLERLARNWQVDLILRGHSHTFCLLPPIVELTVPNKGKLPNEAIQHYKRAGNWGCWLKSYAVGPSSYDSRATYPARPLSTLEIEISPHKDTSPEKTISMRELVI